MKTSAILSSLFMGIFLTTANVNAATDTYDDEVQGFNLHGSVSGPTSITFSSDATAIRRLTQNIRTNSAAQNAFEQKLMAGMCQSGRGTINYDFDQSNQAKITCDGRPTVAPSSKNIFLEAHCAGFCVLHGSAFKNYTNNDCQCRSGNARDLVTTATPQSTPAAPTATASNNTQNNNVQQSRELTRYQECVTRTRKSNPAASADDLKNACGDTPEFKTRDQEKAENRAARADARAENQENKRATKAAECAARTPAMDVKQNALGMWVCTDSADTIAARDAAKANNQTVKNFYNDMETAEKAFLKRIQELVKQKS